LILLQGDQPTEKVRECVMLTTAQIHTQTRPPGLCILALQRHRMSNTNFHEFQKSLNVRSSARHHAQSFQVILHSYIPRNDLLPCIHYTGFSIVSLSLENLSRSICLWRKVPSVQSSLRLGTAMVMIFVLQGLRPTPKWFSWGLYVP